MLVQIGKKFDFFFGKTYFSKLSVGVAQSKCVNKALKNANCVSECIKVSERNIRMRKVCVFVCLSFFSLTQSPNKNSQLVTNELS